ncbi:MAG: MOSC domain-containing protein, partial [Bacteroidota bacterium]
MQKLISVNVSLPKEVTYKGKTVRTGIFKEPVSGRVQVKKLNLEGDGQADLIGHGGEMRAVYVYSYDNYPPWAEELERDDFAYGQFGENFTVQGMLDSEIHIGDQFKIGTALFEVSQPRVPCYKLAMKMGVPDFYRRILKSGRLGFYFRVLEEGEVGAGDEIIPHKVNTQDGFNISQMNDLMYFDKQNYEGFEKALTFKALSPGWRDTFKDRLGKKQQELKTLKAYQTLRVSKIVDESENIRSFYLTPQEHKTEIFQAGQFLPIKLDIPGQYQSIYRTYTISNAPGKDYYRLSIKREDAPAQIPQAYPGVSSTYFHQQVKVGSEILAAPPRGKFYVDTQTNLPLVFISAGVGITPMISMLEYLLEKKDPRPVYFIHGARNGREQAFKNLIQAAQANHPQLKSYIAYSQPLDSDKLGEDYHSEGRLHIDKIKEMSDSNPAANFYV